MTLSALRPHLPLIRSIIIRVEGDELIDIDDRWPDHWDILLIDGGVRRHMVVDNREIDTWINPYIDNGYEVLSYPLASNLPYIPLDREIRLVEQVPDIVARYLGGLPQASVVGELQGEVYFDRGTITVSLDKPALVEMIGMERGETFVVAIDHELRISITPSDPLDGLVHHAVKPLDLRTVLQFTRKTRPGDWLPELPWRIVRFDVRDDRSLVSEPILRDTMQPLPTPSLSLSERLSLAAPADGSLALLSLIVVLSAFS